MESPGNTPHTDLQKRFFLPLHCNIFACSGKNKAAIHIGGKIQLGLQTAKYSFAAMGGEIEAEKLSGTTCEDRKGEHGKPEPTVFPPVPLKGEPNSLYFG